MRRLNSRWILAAALSCISAFAQGATVYVVNDVGIIKSFSGIASGANPMTGGSFAAGAGALVATIPSYGFYQGFTHVPDGRVLGINNGGDIVAWNTIGAWLAESTPTTLAVNVFADKTNGIGPKSGAPAGTVHGLSWDGNTGGFYVVLEGGADPSDGDIRQYATLADLLADNGTDSASTYGGNNLNFYYPDEDAPGNAAGNPDLPGANYFQVAGNGQLEGWQTLADYVAAPGNRTFEQASFGNGVRGAFAVVPEPAALVISGIAMAGVAFVRSCRQR